MYERQYSYVLQFLETSGGNVIRSIEFTVLPDYDKCRSLHFCHLDLMDISYLTRKGSETFFLLFPSQDKFFL